MAQLLKSLKKVPASERHKFGSKDTPPVLLKQGQLVMAPVLTSQLRSGFPPPRSSLFTQKNCCWTVPAQRNSCYPVECRPWLFLPVPGSRPKPSVGFFHANWLENCSAHLRPTTSKSCGCRCPYLATSQGATRDQGTSRYAVRLRCSKKPLLTASRPLSGTRAKRQHSYPSILFLSAARNRLLKRYSPCEMGASGKQGLPEWRRHSYSTHPRTPSGVGAVIGSVKNGTYTPVSRPGEQPGSGTWQVVPAS